MSYGTVENGEVVINSKSFDANVTPVSFDGSGYPGAYVYQYGGNSNWYYYSYANLKDFAFGIDYIAPFDPSVYGSWSVNSSGRITGKIKPQPLIGMPPPIGGIKGGKGFSKMGKSIGNMTGNRNVQQKQFD